MKLILNQIVYLLVRAFVFILNFFPLKVRLFIVENIIAFITFFLPKFKKIARRNLERIFPNHDPAWRESVLSNCNKNLARLLVDFLRIHSVSLVQAEKDFDFPFKMRLLELVSQGRPIVFATGHLGSFELLAHYLAIIGVPLAFVARQIRPPQLDRWWTRQRELNGNSVIERSGALKGTLRHLKNGKAVGVLFDQNITRQHAVFVDWMGYSAATSKLVGIAATRTNAAVVVISIQHLNAEKYKINAIECDFTNLYGDDSLSSEQKILEITKKVSYEYSHMILQNPNEWFWMHRRWKTAPQGVAEDFYR